MSLKLFQSLIIFLMIIIPGCYGSETIPDVYGEGRTNLFIGGICQVQNTLSNDNYINFSDKYDAIYIPTFYDGCFNDLSAVDDATPNWLTKLYAPTYQNGLERSELSYKNYNIIFAYSGGTRSVLTAIEYQGLRANTLVLISPLRGLLNQTEYQGEITYILELGYVKNIVVLQSSKDQLWGNEYYQSRIGENWDNRIEIYNLDEELTSTNGVDAHKEIFSYSYDHLSEILFATVAGTSILAQNIVALTLSVHEGDLNGPVIPNALVSVKDGSGRDFLRTTDDRGSVTITGDSGGWTISASASGYEDKSWYKSITFSSTEYVFLEEIQPPPQRSVVGKWSFHSKTQSFKTPMMSKMKPIDTLDGLHELETETTIDFLSDGTFIQSTEYISPGFEDENYIIRGEWTQRDNNSILLQYYPESQPDSFDSKMIKSSLNGTIEGNIMRGQGIVLYEDIEFYDEWSASRISTEQSGGQ